MENARTLNTPIKVTADELESSVKVMWRGLKDGMRRMSSSFQSLFSGSPNSPDKTVTKRDREGDQEIEAAKISKM
jgi:hypothetical protein